MGSEQAWRPLGRLLVEQCWISEEQLAVALAEQERSGRKLGQILVEDGLISVDDLTTVLLEQCGIDASTQDGFGSGLRDQLARRGVQVPAQSAPAAFSLPKEPEPEPQPQPEPAPRQQHQRRLLGLRRRDPKKALVKKLEKLVKDFERQERELAAELSELRSVLADEHGHAARDASSSSAA